MQLSFVFIIAIGYLREYPFNLKRVSILNGVFYFPSVLLDFNPMSHRVLSTARDFLGVRSRLPLHFASVFVIEACIREWLDLLSRDQHRTINHFVQDFGLIQTDVYVLPNLVCVTFLVLLGLGEVLHEVYVHLLVGLCFFNDFTFESVVVIAGEDCIVKEKLGRWWLLFLLLFFVLFRDKLLLRFFPIFVFDGLFPSHFFASRGRLRRNTKLFSLFEIGRGRCLRSIDIFLCDFLVEHILCFLCGI